MNAAGPARGEPVSIGVVAIGRNEGERLRRCLASVDYPGARVVYVDSGSTDGSCALAASLGAEVVQLDMDQPFTAARARNAGWQALVDGGAAPDVIQFIDGDCEFERGWIERAIAFLASDPKAAVVCGRRRERFPEASFYNRLCDAEWNTPVGQADACGGDAAMRTAALVAAGGFDPLLSAGEEPELCHRLRSEGWTIWRIDAAMTIHDAAMFRFGQWWLRAVRSGLGYAQAWRATAQRPAPLYRRECLRALGWTGGVTLVACALGLWLGWAGLAFAPAVWAAQYLRLAPRYGPRHAGLLLVGKFAEARGILLYLRRALAGRPGGTIFYK
ncbi:glycosyltransferase [Novosphingobium piscinae]|uniref:Glycosyltransferase family 2 protein n=1 Tax=Novosphingobium piscinae TaxID=1507448 RepID=A0A7X1FW83_9SPHN|nr:glycosyltransferase family A protein [Novosphingobium piscinae]MBC2668133.1 glycosyltransferase family 2 protein [Novosphingobium piscinae]